MPDEIMSHQEMFHRPSEIAASFIPIPQIHPNIDPHDIQPNGTLLTDAEINAIRAEIAKMKQGNKDHFKNGVRFSKQELKAFCPQRNNKIPYTIIIGPNESINVIYSGKNNKALGAGSWGRTKLMQNIDTRKFYALKVQDVRNDKHAMGIATESHLANLTGQRVIPLITHRGKAKQKNRKQPGQGQIERQTYAMELAYGMNDLDIARNKIRLTTREWIEIAKKYSLLFMNLKRKPVIYILILSLII